LKQEDVTQNPPKVLTIGYASAEKATKKIIWRYIAKVGFDVAWPGSNDKSLREYLSDEVYAIHPGRGNKYGGECHPLFLKSLDSIFVVKEKLYKFSSENPGI
jgi:hypothetical protein